MLCRSKHTFNVAGVILEVVDVVTLRVVVIAFGFDIAGAAVLGLVESHAGVVASRRWRVVAGDRCAGLFLSSEYNSAEQS